MVASEGEKGILKNLERKSIQADNMFHNLVALMNDELKINLPKTETKKIQIPVWMK